MKRRVGSVASSRAVGARLVVATVLGFAILFGATRASVAEPASATTDAPNIVVILVDDQRFDTLDRMREVRRLIASHGVTFTNAFVTTSECCPSRASILSGQYSHRTGVLQNFGPASYPAFNERSNLAVWLRRAGYQTALVGKYLNDYTVYGHHRIPGRARGRWPRSERCHLDRPKGSHS